MCVTKSSRTESFEERSLSTSMTLLHWQMDSFERITLLYIIKLTHTLCCYIFKKTELNPSMSMGRKNVPSSSGQNKEQSEGTQRWKAPGQRPSPCYGQSLENLWFWGVSAVRLLARLQHSSWVQDIRIFVMGACAECTCCIYLLRSNRIQCVIILHICVFSLIARS